MEQGKIVLNAVTVEMVQDAVEYMDEDQSPLTVEEIAVISELLQDAVMDVIAEFLNSR